MDSKLKLGADPNSVWPELKLLIHAERGVYKFRFFLHGETSVIGQTGITRPLVSIFVKLNFIKKKIGQRKCTVEKFLNSLLTLKS